MRVRKKPWRPSCSLASSWSWTRRKPRSALFSKESHTYRRPGTRLSPNAPPPELFVNDAEPIPPSHQREFWETEKWRFGKIRPIGGPGAGWVWREHWRGAGGRTGDSGLYFSAPRSDLHRWTWSRPRLSENTWRAVAWLTSSLWIITPVELSKQGKIGARSTVVVAARRVCTILCPETHHDITAVM